MLFLLSCSYLETMKLLDPFISGREKTKTNGNNPFVTPFPQETRVCPRQNIQFYQGQKSPVASHSGSGKMGFIESLGDII